jgi:hypothetical protein
MKVNKTANTEAEKRVLEYLEGLDAPELITKINSSSKDIPDALSYCKGLAKSRAQSGCACIEDTEVFGWVVHYFEEDSISKGATPKGPVRERIEVKTEPRKEVPKVKSRSPLRRL